MIAQTHLIPMQHHTPCFVKFVGEPNLHKPSPARQIRRSLRGAGFMVRLPPIQPARPSNFAGKTQG